MRGVDVVVNCVGPNYRYEIIVARAAIEARADLVDLNDEYETTQEMFTLDKAARRAGISIILGLGGSPGRFSLPSIAPASLSELESGRPILDKY